MRISSVVYDKSFIRGLKKYMKRLPAKELAAIKSQLAIFQDNTFDSRLDTHKLKGNLSGYWSFSINDSDRILFRFLSGDTVLFINIGNHGIY